jgi:hypothetical protein
LARTRFVHALDGVIRPKGLAAFRLRPADGDEALKHRVMN